MTCRYSLDGDTFDFHGLPRLDAKRSQRTTGWKSILPKRVDRFFREARSVRNFLSGSAARVEAPRFGLDFHHREEHPKENHSPRSTAKRPRGRVCIEGPILQTLYSIWGIDWR
jgi:hypothetical protein